MPDTAVEEIQSIVESLGGTSTAETVVPALQDLATAISQGGGTIADGSITTDKLRDKCVTGDKINDLAVTYANMSSGAVSELCGIKLYAADAGTAQVITVLGFTVTTITPEALYTNSVHMDIRSRLCWIDLTSGYLESAQMVFSGDLEARTMTVWAKGLYSQATGVMGVDTSWTVTSL